MKYLVFSFLSIFLALSPLSAEEIFTVQPAQKEIRLTGFTRSSASITVSSEVSGRVIKVNYDVGQTVGDQPFCEIDPTFIDFQIQSIRQSLEKIRNARKQNRSRTVYLKKELKRYQKLLEWEGSTEVKRDELEENVDQSKLEGISLKIEEAALKIQLDELKERKKRHSVTAPKGWIIVERRVEPGDIIGLNTPLARAGDYQHLVVPLAVSGEELTALKSLPEVFEAELENRPAKARINWINPEFNEQTRKLSIELALTDHAGENRGGLRFSLPLMIRTQGLWVPKKAVIKRYENPRVTLKKGNEVVLITVLGETDGNLIIADHPRLPAGTELVTP